MLSNHFNCSSKMDKAKARFCVPDLQKERENCFFNQEEITNLLDGGKDKTKLRKTLENIFLSDPQFADSLPPEYLSHEEKYSKALHKAVTLVQKINEDGMAQKIAGQMDSMKLLIGSGLGASLNKDGSPLALHLVMFLPTIMGQGTLEQQGRWMPKAWAGKIIGTYAQTELGHGTFLRGLETTATYDEIAEEFVLHSPTITSYKWWPGGLGKTANYAIVMAQLYTKGRCYGPHPFMVQIRDEETHASLPGITVGEIGPKLGMNTTDNGFLGLNNHRIHRTNMLMRHSQVLKDGTYVQPPSDKLTYGTMVFVRVSICFDAIGYLQKAVTIATRYSAVRHQSEIIPGEPEPQVLDYQTQQYKILPHISAVFAMTFVARIVWDAFNEVTGSIQHGNLDRLPELHALSCGLKAQNSTDSANGIDECRLACGGHGYMASSNLPRLWSIVTASMTYEGENTVMWLQVARYIMKAVNVSQFSAESSLYYLGNSLSAQLISDISNEGILKRWQKSISFVIQETADRLNRLVDSGMVYEYAWNSCSVALVKCAKAHIRYFTCEQFVRSLEKLTELSYPTQVILQRLCRLYLLYYLQINQGDFLRSGSVTAAELVPFENEMYELLAFLRAHAVAIVDSFDIDDRALNSTLGAWDGDVYRRLYEEALKSPLNQTDVPDAFHKYLKPLIKSKL